MTNEGQKFANYIKDLRDSLIKEFIVYPEFRDIELIQLFSPTFSYNGVLSTDCYEEEYKKYANLCEKWKKQIPELRQQVNENIHLFESLKGAGFPHFFKCSMKFGDFLPNPRYYYAVAFVPLLTKLRFYGIGSNLPWGNCFVDIKYEEITPMSESEFYSEFMIDALTTLGTSNGHLAIETKNQLIEEFKKYNK